MRNKSLSDYQNKRLEAISAYLRTYRTISGYSQEELCKYLNLHRNTLIRAENAENITLLSFLELTDTMEIDLQEMFAFIEQ
jgi:transcriptional regulator with XRE-family HTH domain